MKILQKHPLHFLFFSAFPILFFFSHNIEETVLSKTFVPILSVTFTSVILFLGLRSIIGNKEKAGIIVSTFVVLFFSFGHITSFFGSALSKLNINSELLILIVWLVFFVFAVYFVVRSRNSFFRLTHVLNVVSLFLISISLFNIGYYEIRSGRLLAAFKKTSNLQSIESVKVQEPLRDIYYIITDRYAGQKALKDHYNYDNSRFLNFLKENGFYVAGKSHANYSKTFTSLASSLNMEYLDFLTEEYPNTDDWSVVYPLIEDNKVQRFLKKTGYKFIYFGDWWEPTRKSKFADQNFNYYGSGIFDEFTSKLLETTLVYPLIKKDEDWLSSVRNDHEFQFTKLAEVSKETGPKFVFAHMLLPHDPYVYDQNCNLVEKEVKLGSDGEPQAYVNQLTCTNTKFESLISGILKNSDPDPIIVIQSDEGPFTQEFKGLVGGEIDWTALSKESLTTHMLILNALHLPEFKNSQKLLYPTMTPVNTFRIIFNHYFGTDLAILPDKSYIFARMERPYDFIDITNKLK